MLPAWHQFLTEGDWQHIEKARSLCWLRNQGVAQRLEDVAGMIETETDEEILDYFNIQVLEPLGLDTAKEKKRDTA